MPVQKTITLYTYSELPTDKAKERAREWWREASAGDNDFAKFITDEMHGALKALGFDPYIRAGRYLDPRDPRARRSTLQWSGFWSQGDGAAFGGTWYASDCAPGKFLADRPQVYATENGENAKCASNVELHRIAAEVLACKKAGLTFAEFGQPGHYNNVTLNRAEVTDPETDDSTDAPPELSERILEAARDLAHWYYKALEAEYEYQNADDQVAETLEVNAYTFTEDGTRHD